MAGTVNEIFALWVVTQRRLAVSLPTFQDILSVPSSRVKGLTLDHWPLKTGPKVCL